MSPDRAPAIEIAGQAKGVGHAASAIADIGLYGGGPIESTRARLAPAASLGAERAGA